MTKIIPSDALDDFIERIGWPPEDRLPKRRSEGLETLHVSQSARRGAARTLMTTRVAISGICVILAIAHIIWPGLQIDFITLALLVVAVIPWLAPVVRSVELPGGFKIELQDVKAATEKVAPQEVVVPGPAVAPQEKDSLEYLRSVARSDPNLALVGLRIEIERRLSQLAERANLPTGRRSAGAMLRDLARHGQIERQTASGLSDLIALGNQAAHGAEVSPDAAVWALDTAPVVLESLDSVLTHRPNVQGSG